MPEICSLENALYVLWMFVSATCQHDPKMETRMVAPTKRERVTAQKVVNFCNSFVIAISD